MELRLDFANNSAKKYDIDFGGIEEDDVFDDPSYFMSGYCYIFAEALNRIFGYKIIATEKNAHIFCVNYYGGKKYYIDVRGKFSDANEFLYGTHITNFNNCSDYCIEAHSKIEEIAYQYATRIIEKNRLIYSFEE